MSRTVKVDEAGVPYQRSYECWDCVHSWDAPVILSESRNSVNGEAASYCPRCHKRSTLPSPMFRIINGEKVVGDATNSTKRAVTETDERINANE